MKMKESNQFKAVFSFEFFGMLNSKAYRITTISILVVIILASFLPKLGSGALSSLFPGSGEKTLLWADPNHTYPEVTDHMELVSGITVSFFDGSVEAAKEKILAKEAAALITIHEDGSINYMEEQSGTTSSFSLISDTLDTLYTKNKLSGYGLNEEKITDSMTKPQITHEEFGKSFLPAYIVAYSGTIILYIIIIIYGQQIAMSVAKEKANRTMEVLITSVKPSVMIFGKVLGTGSAGLLQFILWLAAGGGALYYNLSSVKGDGGFVAELLPQIAAGLPLMAVFCLLGFLVYSFVFAGLSSMVSKLEETGSVLTPVMLLLVAAYMIGLIGVNTGGALWVTICSFIPFFTPIVMFLRIIMTSVPTWQIVLSIVTTLISIVFLAWFSGKIYQVGVLLYGKPPKLKEIIKLAMVRQ